MTLTEAEDTAIFRAVEAAVNYHGFDARLEMADFDVAEAICDTTTAASAPGGVRAAVESLLASRERAAAEAVIGKFETLADKWEAAMGPRVPIDYEDATCDGCSESKHLVASYPLPDSEPWLCQECDDEGRREIIDLRDRAGEIRNG